MVLNKNVWGVRRRTEAEKSTASQVEEEENYQSY